MVISLLPVTLLEVVCCIFRIANNCFSTNKLSMIDIIRFSFAKKRLFCNKELLRNTCLSIIPTIPRVAMAPMTDMTLLPLPLPPIAPLIFPLHDAADHIAVDV